MFRKSRNRTSFLRVGTTTVSHGANIGNWLQHINDKALNSLPMHGKTPFQNLNSSKRRNSLQPQRNSSSNLNCSRYRDTSATAATPLSLSSSLYIYISINLPEPVIPPENLKSGSKRFEFVRQTSDPFVLTVTALTPRCGPPNCGLSVGEC